MKSPWGSFPIRLAGLGVFVCAMWCGALQAHAAAVNVRVTDAAGKSLPNAVAMLESTSAKLPVTPMTGVEIAQAKRQFNPQVTVVTVGTTIAFPNHDSVRHHVYSFSPTKHFELKLYAGLPSSPVLFDKPGVAVIGCNIHDNMVAWVVVVDTPLHARSGAGGKAQLASVPPGSYRLKVWHSSMRPGQEMSSVALSVGNADVDHDVRLDVQGTEP
jgi:plastocyanin